MSFILLVLLSVFAMGLILQYVSWVVVFFFFSSRRRHTRLQGDWSSDVCSSDLKRLCPAGSRLPRRAALQPPGRQQGGCLRRPIRRAFETRRQLECEAQRSV